MSGGSGWYGADGDEGEVVGSAAGAAGVGFLVVGEDGAEFWGEVGEKRGKGEEGGAD